MKRACIKHIIAALAASGISAAAFAQYVWLDERGVKQYSDRPPPASVPAKRILKEAGRPTQAAIRADTPSEDNTASASATADKEKAPMTVAERNADFLKRRAEQAEKDKKAEEQARLVADKARNCERASDYRRVLESGERISRTDKNGERYFLSDEQRARDLSEARRYAQECKS